jgi:hypothetical protein
LNDVSLQAIDGQQSYAPQKFPLPSAFLAHQILGRFTSIFQIALKGAVRLLPPVF